MLPWLHCRFFGLRSCLTCSPLAGGFSRAPFLPISPMEHGPPCGRTVWGISCAFSWTYAFLSSLSADQSWGHCGPCPGKPESSRLLGKSDGHGVWLQGIRHTTPHLVEGAPWVG